jgi:hypothetical protein
MILRLTQDRAHSLKTVLFFESFFYRQDKALLRFLVICGSRPQVSNLSTKGPTVTFVYSEKGACAIQSQKLGAKFEHVTIANIAHKRLEAARGAYEPHPHRS